MVAFRRSSKQRILLWSPVEVTSVHNNASEGCSVAADPLCRRMDGNITSPLERTEKVSTHAECVVHHHADASATGHLHDRLIIRNVERRVSDVLEEESLCAAVHKSLKVSSAVALGHAYLDAHVTESDREHCECTSIEERLCHDVVARAADVGDRKEHG